MPRLRIMPKGHWDWSMPVPFSQGWKVGNLVFVGGQISADQHGRTVAPGDVAAQTRNVFEHIRRVLQVAGGDLSDIVKLNTYCGFEGEGGSAAEFWEEMARTRAEYLPDPGPVITDVRVAGFVYDGLVIEIEAIAALGKDRRPLAPEAHGIRRASLRASPGWRASSLIFVGGQISGDASGEVIGSGDIARQTRNVFENIKRVLRAAGADMRDVVRLNTYYRYAGSGDAITEFWQQMTKVRMEFLPDPGPSGTAVRVVGFPEPEALIQVEAVAALGSERVRLMPTGHWDWSMPVPFSQGWKVGDFVFVGGQISADRHGRTIGAGDIAAQTRNTFNGINAVLQEAGARMQDVVKLNTYYQFEGRGDELRRHWEAMTKVRMEFLADPGPAATAVRVEGFAYEGLLIEIEAIASIAKE